MIYPWKQYTIHFHTVITAWAERHLPKYPDIRRIFINQIYDTSTTNNAIKADVNYGLVSRKINRLHKPLNTMIIKYIYHILYRKRMANSVICRFCRFVVLNTLEKHWEVKKKLFNDWIQTLGRLKTNFPMFLFSFATSMYVIVPPINNPVFII